MKNFTSLPSFLSIFILIFLFFSGEKFSTAQNYSLEFDGNSNYVKIDPLNSLYDNTNLEITVEAWIFPTDLSGRHTVFSNRFGNASDSWQLEVGTGYNHSNVVAVTGVSTWVAESDDNTINTNQWNHVAMVYQWDNDAGSSNTSIFVNGEQVALQQETDYQFAGNSDPVTIGAGTNGGSFFNGRIDEVRVWSVARSQTEIQEAMNDGLTGDENGLEAYYTMNDGSGTITSDSSPDNNTGTLKPDGSEPKWVADFSSSFNSGALEFDGTDDMINLQSPSSLDVNNTVTVEAWIYPTDLSSRQTIYSTRSGGSSGCWQFETGIGNNNNNVLAVTGPGTWVAVSEDNAVVPDEWNHVVFVKNGESDAGTFYVNGKEIPLQQQTDFTFNDNDDEKTIGNGFQGRIDEVRIWNVARSTEEIRQNMMRSLNETESGLAACFRMGEGEGTTTWDISSNSIEGAIEGNPQWVTDVFPDEAGTEDDPFTIATAFELYWLSVSPDTWDKVFQQTKNINASDFDAWNLNEGFIPIGNNDATDPVAFSGIYDGQGYGISNLMINRSGSGQNQGLFGYTDNALIKNTNIINADINAYENTGALIGNAVETEVSVCSSSGNVSGTNQTGGLVGIADQNTSVNNSYSVASVYGGTNTGGLTGKSSSEINHTYSGGTVRGDANTGGLNGNDDNSTFSASFWDKETSEQETSDGGTGKTTSEMTAQATFIDAGWDFDGESNNGTENIWSIYNNINKGYPYFSNQSVPPEVITGERDVSISPPTVTGEITSLGTSTIQDQGICWNSDGSPTIDDNKTSEGETDAPGAFTSEITGLSDLTTYYVRAYATNESGTVYGEEKELAVGTHFEGMGTENNPFKIYSLDDLKTIGEHSYYHDKYFIQMNDINAYETRNWNGGDGWNSNYTFSGGYDGQGYHISNLYVDNYSNDGTGLFKSINGGKVANLGMVDTYISAQGTSGALAGSAYNAEITNCFSSGTIKGKTSNLSGFPIKSSSLGGLIGEGFSSTFISQCYSSASVTTGTGNLDGGTWVGGLCGTLQNSTLTDSYASGSAKGYDRVGGLVGSSTENNTIANSYSIAYPSGNEYVGGLGGFISGIFPEKSFHDENKTGCNDLGASSTTEMTTRSFFTDAGWDFVEETDNGTDDIWNIDAEINNGYPFLTDQFFPHNLTTNDASDITAKSATANGEITGLGSETVTEHGICWNTSEAPTIDDSKTQEGSATETGSFSANISALHPNTTYYARAYVEDEKRITYGNEVSFTTNTRELTIEGSFSVDDKVYDETTTATINGNNLSLQDIVGDDDVDLTNITAEFEQAEAGSDITVSITNAELTGDDAGNYTLSLDGAPTSSADILSEYQLTTDSSPTDDGTTSGEGTYTEGASITVTATPETGYQFTEWTGDTQYLDDPASASTNLTMPAADVDLTANFEPEVATSINQTEQTKPQVWPNPFDDKINIENAENIERIIIVAQSGQIVFEIATPEEVINTSHFKPGVFIIQIIDDSGKVSLNKLIKK
ncbi:MAG: LamG-like jellyroll fold domain-containing protein [Marinilabilia sp.]